MNAPSLQGDLLRRADSEIQAGRDASALALVEKAITVAPRAIGAQIKRGAILRRLGRTGESIEQLLSVLQRKPDNIQALHQLSISQRAAGNGDASESSLNAILALQPTHRGALAGKAHCALQSGRLAHAIRFAQDALQQNDEDGPMAIQLARLYRTAGWPKQTIALLDRLAARIGNDIQTTLIRAEAYADMGLYEEAGSLCSTILSEAPSSTEAIQISIELALNGYGKRSARLLLHDLEEQLADSGHAQRMLFEALARSGNWPRLLARCQSLLNETGGSNDLALYFGALGKFAEGELHPARLAIARFVELNPQDFAGKMLLADIELALGNSTSSLSTRSEVATTTGLPQQAALLLQVSDLFALDRVSEARELFASLQQLDGYLPSSAYIDEALRRGSSAEADECLKTTSTLRDRFPPPASPPPSSAARSANHVSMRTFMDRARLRRLLDFDGDFEGLGGGVHVAAYLAWRLTQGRYGDYAGWRRQAMQATHAATALYRTPARNEDIEAFIAPLDLTPIEPLIRNGQGFILATAHMGPPVGTYLTGLIPDVTYFQNMMTSSPDDAVGATGVATAGRPREAAIMAVGAIRRGHVLSATPDVDIRRLMHGEAPPGATASGSLFGVRMEISNLIPKLSRELRAPSFWFQPQWIHGQIHLSIQALPTSDPDEAPQAWQNRWAEAYLAKLQEFMVSDPRNQNLNAAPWRYLLLHAHESEVVSRLLR